MKYFNAKNYAAAFELFNEIKNGGEKNNSEIETAFYYSGNCLLKLNQLFGAASEFESFLQRFPFSNFREKVLFDLGTIYYHTSEFRKAREKLSILILENPESSLSGAAYYWIGESFAAENKIVDAEDNFKEAISRRTQNYLIVNSIYSLAQLYERNKDYINAITHYDELLAYYKEHPLASNAQLRIGVCYFLTKEYDSAVLELTDPLIRKLSTTDLIEAKFYLANSFVRLKEYKNANDIYEELLAQGVEAEFENKIRYSLAWIKFQSNDFTGAFDLFDQLSKIEKDTLAISSLFWSAESKRYSGDVATSNQIYKTFLEKYPYHPLAARAQLGKGTIFFSQNLSQEAEASLINASISNDEFTKGKALTLLGELKLNQKKYQDAENYFRQALLNSLNNKSIGDRATLGLGIAQFYIGNVNNALMNLEELNANAPEFEKEKVCFYLAESYLARKEYAASIKYYNKINTPVEDLVKPIIYGKAYAYFNLKDFPNAIYYFNEFVSKYKSDANVNDAKLRLADSYFGIKNFQKASSIYRELFSNDRAILNDDQTYYQYCQSLFKAGKSNEAISEFKRLQQRFPRSKFADASQYVVGWIYFQQNDFRSAIDNYDRLITMYPNSSLIPIAFYSIGDSHFNLGQYDSSIIYYNKVLQNYPNTSYILDAVNGIQYSYLAKDQADLAISFIDQFIDSNPNSKYSDQIFFKKGDIFYSSDNYESAIDAYNDFVRRYPSSQLVSNAYYWIGKSAAILKRDTEALENFKKVISISLKSDIGISSSVEAASLSSIKKQFDLSIQFLNAAIDAQPTSNRVPELLYLRAIAEIKSDNLQQAAYNTLDQIITYYEGTVFSAKAKLELGILEMTKKNFDNALILLRELAEKRLDDIGAQAQFYIGQTYFDQNNVNDAITAFVRVRSVFSSFDEWYTKSLLRLGDCYLKLNDKVQAREMYRAVVNRHKTGEIAQEANRKLKQL